MHVIGSMDLGGAEKLTKLTIEGLRHEEFGLSVCCLKSGGFYAQQLVNKRYPVHVLLDVDKNSKMTFWSLAQVSWRMFFLLRRERPHILHSHLFLASCLARVIGFLAGVRCQIVTMHRIEYPRFQPALERAMGWFTTRYVTDSAAAARLLTTRLGVSAKKIEVIYNGIDTSEFHRPPAKETAKRELGLRPGGFILGIVAHLFEAKGHDFLFESLRHIRPELGDFTLLVVGDGYRRSILEKKATELFEKNQIIFLGQRADLANLLSAMDVLVLPSSWEGFGIVLAEAMYLQVPVITTRDGGGCAEVVEDNDGGMLVDYGDQEALGRAILGFRVDERFRQVQGAKGRARVERKFVAAIMIKGYADLYRRMSSASLAMEKS
ncbi:MAG: glycosyltransferase [Opitutaceae bacterium]